MPPSRNLKELRGLQGRLAYIRRFISNLVDCFHPFSHLMKKGAPFEWDDSCQNAFDSIKRYLSSLPILGAPVPGKPLLLYIAAQECSQLWKGKNRLFITWVTLWSEPNSTTLQSRRCAWLSYSSFKCYGITCKLILYTSSLKATQLNTSCPG